MPRLFCIVLSVPQDQRLSRKICRAISQHDVQPIVISHGNIKEDAVPAKLKRKIDAALFVLPVISLDFERSETMRALTKYAFSVKKIIIPYKVHAQKLGQGLQIMLVSSHWLDVSQKERPEDGILELHPAVIAHRDNFLAKAKERKMLFLGASFIAAALLVLTALIIFLCTSVNEEMENVPAENTAFSDTEQCETPPMRRYRERVKNIPQQEREKQTQNLRNAYARADATAMERALEAGADPNCDVFATSISAGEISFIERLLRYGATPYKPFPPKNFDAISARCVAHGYGYGPKAPRSLDESITEIICDYGFPVNISNFYGATPLRDTVRWNSPHIAKILMSYGADPDLRGKDGESARDLAGKRPSASRAQWEEIFRIPKTKSPTYGNALPADRIPAPMRRFRFDGTDDLSGSVLSAEDLKNGKLVVPGIYPDISSKKIKAFNRDAVELALPQEFDYENFTVTLRFSFHKNARPYTPIIVGGVTGRIFTLAKTQNELTVFFNNRSVRLETGLQLETEKNYDLACAVDAKSKTVIVVLNGNVKKLPLSNDFKLNYYRPRKFVPYDYSCGGAFFGEIDELSVYSCAFDERILTAPSFKYYTGDNGKLSASNVKTTEETIIDRVPANKPMAKEHIADLGDGIKMKFAPVPAGTVNGIPAPAFFIGKTEVTQAQYRALTNENPSFFQGNENRPVEQVSWEDAMRFCALLTVRERDVTKTLPEILVYTLPTNTLWSRAFNGEYARTAEALSRAAWFGGNSGGETHPVGMKAPNSRGIYDMHGNVWEWCFDRSIRGMDYGKTKEQYSANKTFYSGILAKTYKMPDVGFRVVLVEKSELPEATLKILESFENAVRTANVPATKPAQPSVPAEKPARPVPATQQTVPAAEEIKENTENTETENLKYPPIISPKKLLKSSLTLKYPLLPNDRELLEKSSGLRWLNDALSAPNFATITIPMPTGNIRKGAETWDRKFQPSTSDGSLFYGFSGDYYRPPQDSQQRTLLYWLCAWRYGIDRREGLSHSLQDIARDPKWKTDFSAFPNSLTRPPRDIRLYAAAQAIAAGANIDEPGILALADEDLMQLLIEAGANLNARNEKGASALHVAATDGAAEKIRMLVGAGVPVSLPDEDGATPLHYAILGNNRNSSAARIVSPKYSLNLLNAASTLLALGADVNAGTTVARATPLHVAAMLGRTDFVALLLLSGADASLKNSAGATPAQLAKNTKNVSSKERKKIEEIFTEWRKGNKRPAQKAAADFFGSAAAETAAKPGTAPSGAFSWNNIFPNGLVEAGRPADKATTKFFSRFKGKYILIYKCKFSEIRSSAAFYPCSLAAACEQNFRGIIPVLDPAGSTCAFSVIAEQLRRKHQPGFVAPQTVGGALLLLVPDGTADFVLLNDSGKVLAQGIMPTSTSGSDSAFYSIIKSAIEADKRSR